MGVLASVDLRSVWFWRNRAKQYRWLTILRHVHRSHSLAMWSRTRPSAHWLRIAYTHRTHIETYWRIRRHRFRRRRWTWRPHYSLDRRTGILASYPICIQDEWAQNIVAPTYLLPSHPTRFQRIWWFRGTNRANQLSNIVRCWMHGHRDASNLYCLQPNEIHMTVQDV